MEQEIHFTNKDFDFSKITISQPVAVQGGAYFTKIKYDNNPLYIQTVKCITKQGLNETSKKAYVDLMYTNDDDEIVEWFESLESRLVDLIFSKSELWFQNEMEMSDIENNFNSITRAFKGGKYHLVRVNIPKNKTINSQYNCNMYDENETVIPLQELKESQFIIPILEIHGIKFSARSFQVDVFGKQIMLLDNKPIFNSCLIKKSTLEGPKALEESTHSDNKMESLEETHDNNNESDLKTDELSNNNKISEQIQTDNEEIIDELLDNNECDVEETVSETKQDDSETIEMVQDKNEIVENKSVLDSNYLEEVSDNITITDNLDTNIKLRKPNEVYYEIYKITKEKAKQHKKAAIAHYLEAKKIKNSYLLESMEASDDSSDDEITNDSEKIKKDINDLVEELY